MPPLTRIHPMAGDLVQITLYPPIPGFEEFLSLWLWRGEETFLVDTGPAVTAPGVIQALEELGALRLDAVLLTHVHLDHAGAAGHLAAHFPECRVVAHPAGIPHLADPQRLWEGTVKTLGNTGRAYAPPRPVPADRLVSAAEVDGDGFRAVLTPGHAVHHASYLAGEYLFAGEAAGVYLAAGGREYLRPATPPRFFLDTALESLERLARLAPETICYGHYGMRGNAGEMLARHQAQLLRWARIIGREVAEGAAADPVGPCLEKLLAEDPELAAYAAMPPAVREREKGFLVNSVKGFVGYFKSLPAGSSR